MKTRLGILKLTILLCCIFVTTAAFGQTLTWVGLDTTPNSSNLGVTTNWSGGSPLSGTTLTFDGTVSGNMNVFSSDGIDHNFGAGVGPIGGSFGSVGINIHITSTQTNPVQIVSSNFSAVTIGLNTITVDSGAGQLTLGDNSANDLDFTMRPAGATHDFVNNSAHPVIIYPNVSWQQGGGAVYTLILDGTGDWGITNQLQTHGGGGISLAKLGTGTWTWSGPSIGPLSIGGILSPFTINAGILILKTNGLLANQNITNNGATPTPIIYDGNSPQTLGGVVSGPITLTVKSGTLTLSGASTFTGNITNSGGELIVNRAENAGVSGPLGEGNTISFTGGTLGWSVNNSFDYSSRFSTDPNQVYNFDTGGQLIALSSALGSSGGTLTKLGSGTLTLSGTSSYSGLTTVSVGKLIFQGPKAGTANISVADGAALGVTATITQVTPNTLTIVGTGSGAALEFNSVSSTLTAPLAPTTLASSGAVTINVNSGTFTLGQTYPLLTWTTGSAPTASLGVLNGFTGFLTNDPANTVSVVITGTAYVWTGLNNGSWDLSTANNWTHNGGPAVFANGAPTLFDDTAAGTTNVTINDLVQPSTLTVNNGSLIYSIISSSGHDIGGSTGLTKDGTNTLSLSGGANAYTGVTLFDNGMVTVSWLTNGGLASDIGAASANATNLVFNGGTLQYTNSTVQIDRLFQIATSGGTIDASGSGALEFTNTGAIAYLGNGARTLTLTGTTATNNTLAAVLADYGGVTSLAKSGTGEWDLTATNTYSGVTTINNGVLQIGNGGSTGSLGTGNTTNNGTLIFNRANSLTYSGAISGTGAVTVASGNITLTGNNNYSGGTTVSNGATLNIGNGGANANLAAGSPVLNNGFMKFNSTTPITIRGFAANISGTGNFEIAGTGKVSFDGAKLYTGWTLIDPGATLQVSVGNEWPGMAGPPITNNGTLYMQRQDFGVFIITNNIVGTGKMVKDSGGNSGDVTLFGTNTYTGGTIIGCGAVVLGDGVTAGSGSIVGDVIFTNSPMLDDGYRQLEFNRPDSFTFSGNILSAVSGPGWVGLRGVVFQNGTGVLTLTGNNTYVDGTIVSNGVLQVGNGGTTGSISTNTLKVGTMIVFNRSDAITFPDNINGTTGVVVQAGSGTLTLAGQVNLTDTNVVPNNSGAVTVSNGTLVVSSGRVYGNVNVSGGTFVSPAVGTVGTLSVSNNLMIGSGTIVATVNKSLSPSNTVYLVASNLTATGGTLKLVNYGPALVPGDRFVIFKNVDVTTKAVTGGNLVTISAPGVTSWINNLATDGSVTVQAVTATPLAFTTAARSGANLNLTWPAAWTGVHLQSQTNTLAKGLFTNWVTIPGTDAANGYTNILNTTNGSVFFRLAP